MPPKSVRSALGRDDRFRTVVRLLARGVVRCIEVEQRLGTHDLESSESSPDSDGPPLELPSETSLTVSRLRG